MATGGGGILNRAGTLNVNNSTISWNVAPGGGGIAGGPGNPFTGGALISLNNTKVDDNTSSTTARPRP